MSLEAAPLRTKAGAQDRKVHALDRDWGLDTERPRNNNKHIQAQGPGK